MRSFLFLFLLALPLAAQTPPVSVSLTPASLTVGDPVKATITVRVRTEGLAGDPRFPFWGKTWGEAEVLEAGTAVKVSERNGRAVWEQRLTLTVFKPGKVALPPIEIAIPRKERLVKAKTPAGLALEVKSVLPPGERQPEPKPAAPPVQLPLGERFWWTAAILGALTLAAAFVVFLQRRAGAEAAGAAPALEPFEELAAELDRLHAEPSPVALHTHLSLALRRYLARRFPFPALESTTTDIQRQLLSRRVPGPLARHMVELLRACDLVKFARLPVGETQSRERLAAARKLAHDYEAFLAPREPRKLEAAG
ncbi:MAG TPA: hypothetical protein VG477_03515 [Thermoanaerobaculia bacterium]|nr:hypothetical protein [Thermoanaerobaculia bacterium]